MFNNNDGLMVVWGVCVCVQIWGFLKSSCLVCDTQVTIKAFGSLALTLIYENDMTLKYLINNKIEHEWLECIAQIWQNFLLMYNFFSRYHSLRREFVSEKGS